MTIEPAGDSSLLVSFAPEISLAVHQQVHSLYGFLKRRNPQGLVNLHPAYCTVLIEFNPLQASHAEIEAAVRGWGEGVEPAPESRLWEIPVCYGGEFGPDLEEVAKLHDTSTARVVELHSSVDYLVYFLGFSPGFPYLGGLPDELATPRLAAPRTRVPAGSVAIGGSQTGIYPTESPGGWRIIGRTPWRLFEPVRAAPALLAMGDRVRFVPVPPDEFARPR
jgi:KipI family sensor histidine kinase inhibitor